MAERQFYMLRVAFLFYVRGSKLSAEYIVYVRLHVVVVVASDTSASSDAECGIVIIAGVSRKAYSSQSWLHIICR